MALTSCVRAMPVLARRVSTPCVQQVRSRSLWFDPWSRSSDIRALVRDMDRQMDRLEREMLRVFPTMLPRRLEPVSFDETLEPSEGGQYRVSLDLAGFKPEEIDVSLDESGRKLTIHAKCEKTGKGGSRFSQDITRVLTLPEAIDTSQLKSLLHANGYLAVEAPFKEALKEPKQIPINKFEDDDTKQLQSQGAPSISSRG